ncbi:MAG: 50S ribosomal protein L25 [Patescibacteria group bacterium]
MVLTIKTKQREFSGKKAKKLRLAGVLPAVLYGAGQKSQNIELDLKEFQKIWKEAGESSLIELDAGGSKRTVLIKEIQTDPVKDTPVHVDFYAVKMDKSIKAAIPIDFIGESPAVKNLGGSMIKVMHEIEIEALPADLPSKLKIDVSKLAAIGDRFLVSDFKLPASVKILANTLDIVVLIEEPKKEEEPAAEAKPSIENIEVVGKKGKEAPAAGEEETGKEKIEKKAGSEEKKP